MSTNTSIEWCDSTFNPWMGCTKVSPACDHCYAERDTARFGRVEWGTGKTRVRTSAANWKKPLQWDAQPFVECMSCAWRGELREAEIIKNPQGFYPPVDSSSLCPGCRQPMLMSARRRVFCASLADVFDKEVPVEWLADLLDLIRRTPNIDWLLLTKRIGNWYSRISETTVPLSNSRSICAMLTRQMAESWLGGKQPTNVWIGATICNQPEADRDVEKLLLVPALVRFLSIEPMLGPIDLNEVPPRRLHGPLSHYCRRHFPRTDCLCDMQQAGINWVIAGGESRPHARPMHPDWVRTLRDQCAEAGVPFLFKQWGEWAPEATCAGGDLGGDLRRGVVQHLHAPGNPDGHFRRGDAYVRRIGKKAAGRLLDGQIHNAFPSA